MYGPVFIARYEGPCEECDIPVRPGEFARMLNSGGAIHADTSCEDGIKGERQVVRRPPCPVCTTEHPGEC